MDGRFNLRGGGVRDVGIFFGVTVVGSVRPTENSSLHGRHNFERRTVQFRFSIKNNLP